MRICASFVMLLTMLADIVRSEGDKATLDLFPLESELNGNWTWVPDLTQPTLRVEGFYSHAGTAASAKGVLKQIHTCSRGDQRVNMTVPWVAYIKLASVEHEVNCLPLYDKARMALKQGATSVVLDITNYDNALDVLLNQSSDQLKRPLLTVTGDEAVLLKDMFRDHHHGLFAEMKLGQTKRNEKKPLFDLGIFIGLIGLLCLICFFVIVKLKWGSRRRQPSLTSLAKKILSKMETRRYHLSSYDIHSKATLDCENCAICLEEYRESQELRILPCHHEFHRSCVDPWLIANHTCPLCLFNIIDCPGDNDGSMCSSREESAQTSIHPSSSVQPSMYNSFIPTPASSTAQYGHQYQRMTGCTGVPAYTAPVTSTVNSLPLYSSLNHHQEVYSQLRGCVTQTAAHLATTSPISGVPEWLQTSSRFSVPPPTHLHQNNMILARDISTAAQKHSNYKPPIHSQKTRLLKRSGHSRRHHHKAALNSVLGHKHRRKAHSPQRHRSLKHRRRKEDGEHTSSESEHELRLGSYKLPQHYASSVCDADISGTSTGGVDSDTPCFDSSLNISNQSICGSSDVRSDISSVGSFLDQQICVHSLPLPNSLWSPIACQSNPSYSAMQTPYVTQVSNPGMNHNTRIVLSDSDDSLSSNDTSGISPVVSEWADTAFIPGRSHHIKRRAPSSSHYFNSDFVRRESCSLCSKDKQLTKSYSFYGPTFSSPAASSLAVPNHNVQTRTSFSTNVGYDFPYKISHSTSAYSPLSRYSCPFCIKEKSCAEHMKPQSMTASMTSGKAPMTSKNAFVSVSSSHPSKVPRHTDCHLCNDQLPDKTHGKSYVKRNKGKHVKPSFLSGTQRRVHFTSADVMNESSHPLLTDKHCSARTSKTSPQRSTYVVFNENEDTVRTFPFTNLPTQAQANKL